MSPVVVSRILFGLLVINEAVVVGRSKSGEIQDLNISIHTKILGVLMLAPFFFALGYPDWLGWTLVGIQAAGLALEVASEVQLARAHSFAISEGAATAVQKRGMYRFLENPIYVGIVIQITAWAVWMPPVLIEVILLVMVVRGMVANERRYLLENHQTSHRGIDSVLWNQPTFTRR